MSRPLVKAGGLRPEEVREPFGEVHELPAWVAPALIAARADGVPKHRSGGHRPPIGGIAPRICGAERRP